MTALDKRRVALDSALEALEAAKVRVNAAAQAYARAGVIAYSAAHPRREVQLAIAMGATCLHVERGGTCKYKGSWDYQITADRCDIGDDRPEFLVVLSGAEDESDIPTLGGTVAITCKGGKIVREVEDW